MIFEKFLKIIKKLFKNYMKIIKKFSKSFLINFHIIFK